MTDTKTAADRAWDEAFRRLDEWADELLYLQPVVQAVMPELGAGNCYPSTAVAVALARHHGIRAAVEHVHVAVAHGRDAVAVCADHAIVRCRIPGRPGGLWLDVSGAQFEPVLSRPFLSGRMPEPRSHTFTDPGGAERTWTYTLQTADSESQGLGDVSVLYAIARPSTRIVKWQRQFRDSELCRELVELTRLAATADGSEGFLLIQTRRGSFAVPTDLRRRDRAGAL